MEDGMSRWVRRVLAVWLALAMAMGGVPTRVYAATESRQAGTFRIVDRRQLFPEVSGHVQTFGWTHVSNDGGFVGSTGMGKRLEAITLAIPDAPYAGGVRYRTYVQGSGWQAWKRDGAIAGTWGKSKRIEAVKIGLYGTLAKHFDVYYRVHVQGYGWMAWINNGAAAGTKGKSKRVEAFQIVVLRKGSAVPPTTYKGVVQTCSRGFVG